MIRWGLPMLAVILALALGLAGPSGGAAVRPQGNEAVLGWLLGQGMRPVAELRMGPAEADRVWMVQGADGCEAAVAPLRSAEASLPLLRHEIAAEGWNATRLWLGTLQGWPESPLVILWRRFVLWTKHGSAAPAPALVTGPARCLETLASAE